MAKISLDHKYHGAALTQIAEHPQFTAINSLMVNAVKSRCAFRINADRAVYLKYATAPNRSWQEFVFTFTAANLLDLSNIASQNQKVVIGLVCVKANEICGIEYPNLMKLIARRERAFGAPEPHYTLLATLDKSEAFRLYVNQPGVKKVILGEPLKIARNKFPAIIF